MAWRWGHRRASVEGRVDGIRISTKLTLALTAGIFLVMAAFAMLQVRREVSLFRSDLKKSARLGRSLRATVEQAWQTAGEARARALVEEADDETAALGIRVVRLDAAGRTLGLSDVQREALRHGEEVRVVATDHAGDRRRSTLMPLDVGGEPVALEIFESLKDQLTFVRSNRIALVAVTLAVTVVSGGIVMWLSSIFVSGPIDELRDLARRIGAGDLSQRLPVRRRDEIGQLAGDLNAMCDLMAESQRRLGEETDRRIAALEQLRHTDRLATVGRLASAVAHQLGTPLSVVSMRAKMIAAQAGGGGDVGTNARVIAEQTDRMADTIRGLLDFSRRPSVARARRDLAALARDTLELLGPVAQRRRLRIDLDLPAATVPVVVEEAPLQQAIANVVLNAFQAMEPGGTLRLHVGRRPFARDEEPAVERAFVEIEDDGPGIAPDRLARLFEPFFTTKPAGEGTGLGLPVAEGIVRDHGGWIAVESEPGRGARFTIVLDLAAGELEDAS